MDVAERRPRRLALSRGAALTRRDLDKAFEQSIMLGNAEAVVAIMRRHLRTVPATDMGNPIAQWRASAEVG